MRCKNKKRNTNLNPEPDLEKQQKCIKIRKSWAAGVRDVPGKRGGERGAVSIHRRLPPFPWALLLPLHLQSLLKKRSFPTATLSHLWPLQYFLGPHWWIKAPGEGQWRVSRAFEKQTPLYLPSSERFKDCWAPAYAQAFPLSGSWAAGQHPCVPAMPWMDPSRHRSD